MSEEAKAKGNAAFSSGDYSSVTRHFTEAIFLSHNPNHVLYSYRYAAHASLGDFPSALEYARKTVELNPSWPKGYSRLGAALLGLKDFAAAVDAYQKGLELDPSNEALKSGLAVARAAVRSRSRGGDEGMSNPFGDIFKGQEMWAKLTADPAMRGYLAQPDFVKIMQEIQRNPNMLNLFQKDQRVMKAIEVLLNVNFHAPGAEDLEMTGEHRGEKRDEVKPPQPSDTAPAEEMEIEEELGEEEKEKKSRAACYTKLDALLEGLAEKCIELNPTFSKGYTRKGAIMFFMKKKYTALETYQEGLKGDVAMEYLFDIVRSSANRCVEQINKASRGDFTPEELKERRKLEDRYGKYVNGSCVDRAYITASNHLKTGRELVELFYPLLKKIKPERRPRATQGLMIMMDLIFKRW